MHQTNIHLSKTLEVVQKPYTHAVLHANYMWVSVCVCVSGCYITVLLRIRMISDTDPAPQYSMTIHRSVFLK